MARLAALVPRPRANLTRYHGVFAPNCGLRKAVVSKRGSTTRAGPASHLSQASDRLTAASDQAADEPNTDPQAPLTWAQRLKRVFLIDITLCPHCGGTLRVIADVTEPALIERILAHVRKRGPPAPRRAPRTPQHQNLLDAS